MKQGFGRRPAEFDCRLAADTEIRPDPGILEAGALRHVEEIASTVQSGELCSSL